jgi:prefoldin subunit 5
MFLAAQHTLLNLVLMLTLNVSGIQPVFQTEPVEVVQQRYKDGLDERLDVVNSMKKLEAEHRRIVARIVALKQQGAGLTVRLALDEMLRDAQRISDQLAAKQDQVRVIDNRLGAHRTQLISAIENSIQNLEIQLRSAPAQERGAIVRELNKLRTQRASYMVSLPEVPSLEDLRAALTLATKADSPDELHAVADELQDSEDQLRRRLAAIEARIDDLKKSKRLVRRAQGFTREERFFEETDRERTIARYERTTTTGQSSDSPQTPQAGSESPNQAGSPEPTESQNNDPGAFDDVANESLSPSFGSEADPDRGSTPPLSDASDFPSAAPDNGNDVFESTESILIQTAEDPSRAVDLNGQAANSTLDGQIRHLESEKERLEKQAEMLKSRANDLRRRASDL